MNGPPFPLNPEVGERFGNWVWNGVRWVSSRTTGIQVVTTVFTASGPYMPSPGLTSVVVECIGGGGGGGAAPSDTGSARAGAGGGSGGYSRKTLPATLVAGGVQVTIGAGGVAGSNNPPQYIGGTGGATTFGALCSANGGGGGPSYGVGGAGGAPGVGDIALPGAAGESGTSQIVTTAIDFLGGGLGGAMWGGNVSTAPVSAGSDGYGASALPNTGAGGSGGVANASATPIQGGSGGSGICIVTEYCWADASDDCVNPPVEVNARVAVTHVPWTGPGPCPPGWGQIGYDGDE